MKDEKDFVIVTFYKFTELSDLQDLKSSLVKISNKNDLKGTIILAKEGINGTIVGFSQGIEELCAKIKSISCFKDIDYKYSYASFKPFRKMKIKIKDDIITFKSDQKINLTSRGEYLSPDSWDDLIQSDDVIVLDTRNHYEVVFGTFKNAINPQINDFSQLAKWLKEHKEQSKNKKIAMFCTGGVRCEKSTAYAKEVGYEKVYHLKGGILKYLEERQGKKSLWQGNCYVFDDRIAIDSKMKPINNKPSY